MKKFQKTLALATATAMMLTLAACGGTTSSSIDSMSAVGASTDALIVQVESVEGSTVTAVVGELTEGQGGGAPNMPGGEAPSGAMEGETGSPR